MNAAALQEAVRLAQGQEYLFVATADRSGLPHLAAAKEITGEGPDRIAVSAWFCPGTVKNLGVNRRLAVVIWGPKSDKGYQMLGTAEKVEDVAYLDGMPRPEELKHPVPQVERKVTVHVTVITAFQYAPHTDDEL